MSLAQHFRYASLGAPLALLGLPLYVFVPAVYAELPLLGLELVGLVLLAARLLDLVTDPLMGYMVDRWRSHLHPFHLILIGAPLLLAGTHYLFNPSLDAGPTFLAVSVSATYLGWTLIAIPYYSWGAELGGDAQGQQRLAAWREGSVIIGSVLALLFAVTGDGALANMAVALLVLVPLSLLLMSALPKRAQPLRFNQPASMVSVLASWRAVEPAMRRLLWVHFLNALAAGMPATLFLLYAGQVLGLDGTQSGVLLLLYFLSGILALPLWMRLARRIGQLRAWRLAMLFAAVAFVPAFFLGSGDLVGFAAVCLLTGSTLGADIALPAAMQARLSNHTSEQQGRATEGTAFGLWGVTGKLALAAAVGVTFPLLGLFPEGAGRVEALAWLYALLPIAMKVLAAHQLGGLSRFSTFGVDPRRQADEMALDSGRDVDIAWRL